MSELSFKGKEFVYNHHLSVPFRPLLPVPEDSLGDVSLDGNLIVHGDNLHALKALVPRFAGRVDCVFIDPPYNTGNESWCYNDNVNAPMIREWLNSNPVGVEDGLRHDKWCAMMWPRLRLLHELLSDDGSFWMTIDDNEAHRARELLDEIFGEENFVATCIWHKSDSPKNTAMHFSVDHDYILVYAKNKEIWRPNLLDRSEAMLARYTNPDNDPRGPWMTGDLDARNYYSKGEYPIQIPGGRLIPGPPQGRYWTVSEEKFWALDADNRIWWGADGKSEPNIKKFLSEVRDGVVPRTIWHWTEAGSTRHSKQELNSILHGMEGDTDPGSEAPDFVTPKPSRLLERILAVATNPNSVVLDSFAGSGTTAHAVLKANAMDGGQRRFILVEMEAYATTLTAERVRRVMQGYDSSGTQKSELLRMKLTWTVIKNAKRLMENIASIEESEGRRYDRIRKTVKDGELLVWGETTESQRVAGLGGAFTFCTLGQPVELDALLTGVALPEYWALGAALFHMATSSALPSTSTGQDWYIGSVNGLHVWLLYKPDLEWLKSSDAALTLTRAKDFAEYAPDERHLVFAPARYVSKKMLAEHNLPVDFAPLPFALYRIDRS